MLSPKREHMVGVIKENWERETDGNKEMEPSLVNSVLLDGQWEPLVLKAFLKTTKLCKKHQKNAWGA